MNRDYRQRPSWPAGIDQIEGKAAVEYTVGLGLIGALIVAAGYLTPVIRTTFAGSAPGTAESIWLLVVTPAIALASFVTGIGIGRRRRIRSASPGSSIRDLIPPDVQSKFVAKRQMILAFLSSEKQQLVNGQMMAKHLMSQLPLKRSASDDVAAIRVLMSEHVIRHLLVCSAEGKLVGIISDRDVNNRPGEQAGDIMTPDPLTVSPEAPIGSVITTLLTHRISCIPVVEDERVCGIITTSDLLMALQCVLRLIEQLALPLDLRPTDSASDDHVASDRVVVA